MKITKKIQRIFDICNLEGEEVNIYAEIKKVYIKTPENIEAIYDYIAERMGF